MSAIFSYTNRICIYVPSSNVYTHLFTAHLVCRQLVCISRAALRLLPSFLALLLSFALLRLAPHHGFSVDERHTHEHYMQMITGENACALSQSI